MPLRPHLPRRSSTPASSDVEQLGHVVVGDGHPLGDTGGARGVDEVGDVIGGRRRQCGAGLGVDSGVVDIDDQQIAPVQPVGQPGGGDRGDRRGIGEHELDPRRRQRRVDRQIGRPSLEHRQHRHDRLRRTRKQQRHTLTRAHTVSGQQVRQPVSGLLKLAVSHGQAPAADRHRLRGARHLRGEQHRNRHRRARRLGQHRPVAPPIQPGVLTGIQQIQRRQRPPRIGGHRHQHPL